MKEQNETNTIGEIQIEDQVICEYVASTVTEFEGVSRLSSGYIDNFQNILGRESVSGIKLNRDDDKLTISVRIIVYYGVNIPQLAYDIQNKVKEVIDSYIGMNVTAVNIDIEGVDKPIK